MASGRLHSRTLPAFRVQHYIHHPVIIKQEMTDQSSLPSASGSGGGGKRPRGRPLKSTVDEDESAIKRRARVRKAQQAFQKRKEAAARSLEERLAAVQNGLEEFSTEFSSFTTAVAQSDIPSTHPDLLRQIHGLTEQLLALARIASPESPHDAEAGPRPAGPDDDDEQGPSSSGAGFGMAQNFNVAITPGVEHLFLSDADPTQSRESSTDDFQLSYAFVDHSAQHQATLWDPVPRPFGHASDFFTPLPDYIYDAGHRSFDFGEALLLRTTTIACKDLLRTNDLRADPVSRRKFKFCLDSRSRDEMLFLVYLGSQGALYNIKYGVAPLTDIEEAYRANTDSLARSAKDRMIASGELGSFISSHDMESYLRNKGVTHIGHQTMQMRVPVPKAMIASQEVSRSSNQTENDYLARTAEWVASDSTNRLRPDQMQANSLPNPFLPQGADAATFDQQASTTYQRTAHTIATITLSVQTLFNCLATISVCTGQGVAYEKDSIDKAIVSSTISVVA